MPMNQRIFIFFRSSRVSLRNPRQADRCPRQRRVSRAFSVSKRSFSAVVTAVEGAAPAWTTTSQMIFRRQRRNLRSGKRCPTSRRCYGRTILSNPLNFPE